MHKVLSILLTAAMLTAAFVLPTSAVAFNEQPKVVYSEDFESVQSFADLSWEEITVLGKKEGTYEIKDGKLLIDHQSGDSYFVVVDEATMKDVAKEDYTVEFDLKYLSAGNDGRYVALLLNYDRVSGNNYVSFHLRVRGNADFQTRAGSKWTTIDSKNGSKDGDVTRPQANVKDDDAISNYLFGKKYDTKKYPLLDQAMTVRLEYYAGDCMKVFVNDKFVTATDEKGFASVTEKAAIASEIALKVGAVVKCELDNIVVTSLPTYDKAAVEAFTADMTAKFDAEADAIIAALAEKAVAIAADAAQNPAAAEAALAEAVAAAKKDLTDAAASAKAVLDDQLAAVKADAAADAAAAAAAIDATVEATDAEIDDASADAAEAIAAAVALFWKRLAMLLTL